MSTLLHKTPVLSMGEADAGGFEPVTTPFHTEHERGLLRHMLASLHPIPVVLIRRDAWHVEIGRKKEDVR